MEYVVPLVEPHQTTPPKKKRQASAGGTMHVARICISRGKRHKKIHPISVSMWSTVGAGCRDYLPALKIPDFSNSEVLKLFLGFD